MCRRVKFRSLFALVIIAIICVLFYLSQVSPVPSSKSVQKYIDEINLEFKKSNCVTDIQKVSVVQKYILELAPILYRKEGHVWEINELAKMKIGSCYDRSRAIETLLTNLGYQTRHMLLQRSK